MVPRLLGTGCSAEEVTVGVDLRGRVAVVTGCTSGIGYETMRVLALRGAHVFGTGPNILNDAEMAARLWRVSEEMTGVTWRLR